MAESHILPKHTRRQHFKHFTKLCAAFLLSACMIFSTSPVSAHAATSEQKRAEADAVMKQLDNLQTEINQVQERHDQALAAQQQAESSMKEAESRIAAAEERIAANHDRLSQRAVAMYRNGSISMLDVLVGSSSFSDFVNLYNMVDSINEYNAAVIQESKSAREEAALARQEYAAQKEAADRELQVVEQSRTELSQKAESMKAQVAQLTQEAQQLQEAEEAAAEAARRAAEAARRASSRLRNYTPDEGRIVGNGQFAHPCPGCRAISSGFGYRTFDNSFHKGLDFAANEGTPIYAAEAGTVVIAGYSGSAGNWVVISHGGGVTTKYMHMVSTPFVSAGQTVSKGQNIGAVGTTGNSSGNHLHFQVEVDGSAVNPLYFL